MAFVSFGVSGSRAQCLHSSNSICHIYFVPTPHAFYRLVLELVSAEGPILCDCSPHIFYRNCEPWHTSTVFRIPDMWIDTHFQCVQCDSSQKRTVAREQRNPFWRDPHPPNFGHPRLGPFGGRGQWRQISCCPPHASPCRSPSAAWKCACLVLKGNLRIGEGPPIFWAPQKLNRDHPCLKPVADGMC